jgi:hypothetical protein
LFIGEFEEKEGYDEVGRVGGLCWKLDEVKGN